MATFTLEIVAADRMFYHGPCELVVLPCIDGEKGVLANHEPMVMALAAGELRYTVEDEVYLAAVGDGFAEITGDKVEVIVSFAEKPEEIDEEKAERAKQLAEEQIKMKTTEIEYIRIQAELAREMACLKVLKKKFPHTGR